MKCRQCGLYLPSNYITDICLNCSKDNLRKTFKEHPDVKEAFKETIDEMRKPENIKKMTDDVVRFMQAIQSLRK